VPLLTNYVLVICKKIKQQGCFLVCISNCIFAVQFFEMKKIDIRKSVQKVLFFSKWKRKSYSVFQSMNRVVLISVLSINYFCSVPATAKEAVSDTTEVKLEYDLDEIEISAQRSPALYSQVARIVSVIERKEIESAPAQSVQDLLEYVAGVDIRQRGAEGVQADVGIRGGSFDQTLVLLNGINITDPQTGHHNLNIPVSLSQIERIEVLQGPAARVYGPNAFSGAINIVTSQPENNLAKVLLNGGSFGYLDGDLSGSVRTGKLHHSFSLNRKRSGGYIENTDFEILNLFYSNKLNVSKGAMSFQFGFSEKGFGANSFYTPKYPNQFEETKTLLTSIKWESNSRFHITPVVYFRKNHDRFELFRDNPPSWYTTHNYHLTNTYGANLNSWVQSHMGKSAIGVEFRSENILSNVLGDEMVPPVEVPGENAFFTKSKNRATVSGFIEHVYYSPKLTVSAGLLSNYITGSGSGINFFPGIDASYKILPYINLFSSFNTSLRVPTFTDLFYQGPTNIGNPDLKPEKTATYEVGFKLTSDLMLFTGVGYYRNGKDMIDWVKRDEADKWQPQNLTKINSFGTEFQLQFNLQNYFGHNLPKIKIDYFFNTLKKAEGQDYISNYVLDNLKHKLVAAIGQTVLRNFYIDMKILFQDRAGTYTQYVNNNWGNKIEYDPFWIFDGKVNYTLGDLRFYVSINNIFNRNYIDIGNVVQPGRWTKIGVSYELDFD
jgi:iron complex outermembrane receptor protein